MKFLLKRVFEDDENNSSRKSDDNKTKKQLSFLRGLNLKSFGLFALKSMSRKRIEAYQ